MCLIHWPTLIHMINDLDSTWLGSLRLGIKLTLKLENLDLTGYWLENTRELIWKFYFLTDDSVPTLVDRVRTLCKCLPCLTDHMMSVMSQDVDDDHVIHYRYRHCKLVGITWYRGRYSLCSGDRRHLHSILTLIEHLELPDNAISSNVADDQPFISLMCTLFSCNQWIKCQSSSRGRDDQSVF